MADEARPALHARIHRKSPGTTAPTDQQQAASHLVAHVARRLEIVSIVAIVAVLVLWLLRNYLFCELPHEPSTPLQWAPPIAMLPVSAVMLAIARSGRCSSPTLVRIGLAYEVV